MHKYLLIFGLFLLLGCNNSSSLGKNGEFVGRDDKSEIFEKSWVKITVEDVLAYLEEEDNEVIYNNVESSGNLTFIYISLGYTNDWSYSFINGKLVRAQNYKCFGSNVAFNLLSKSEERDFDGSFSVVDFRIISNDLFLEESNK